MQPIRLGVICLGNFSQWESKANFGSRKAQLHFSTLPPSLECIDMADASTTPFEVMKQITGFKWAPGDGPNKTIGTWLSLIGSSYPNTSSYCKSVMHREFFQWCGLTVAYCMTKAGIAPVFGSKDTDKFLYALAWLDFGDAVQTPTQGDVVVFNFGGGDHHVTLFDSDLGNGYWACRGGNQAREVEVSKYPKSDVMGIRRPSGAAPMMAAVDAFAADFTEVNLIEAAEPSVPNRYPDFPVVAYMKTSMTPGSIANELIAQGIDINVARAAYVLICNESASGRKGINNNYGGLQADVGRWSHEYDSYISATCVLTDSGGAKRRFLCFSTASGCFQMITSLIQKRGLYVGGETNFIVSMKINTPSDWANAYYKEWVKGRKDAEIDPAESRSLVSLYQSAIDALPLVA